MSIGLYMDEHVPEAITEALRARGVDVLTCQEDSARGLNDADSLDRATTLGRVLFTQDTDLLRIGAASQLEGKQFAGVIFARQRTAVARCIDDLELLAGATDPDEWANRVEYVPLG